MYISVKPWTIRTSYGREFRLLLQFGKLSMHVHVFSFLDVHLFHSWSILCIDRQAKTPKNSLFIADLFCRFLSTIFSEYCEKYRNFFTPLDVSGKLGELRNKYRVCPAARAVRPRKTSRLSSLADRLAASDTAEVHSMFQSWHKPQHMK